MNKDDDLNSEKMVEKCCSCVGWGSRSGTTKRWARPTLTMGWDGMGWDGMGWDGMGWDGMGWDGMGCHGNNYLWRQLLFGNRLFGLLADLQGRIEVMQQEPPEKMTVSNCPHFHGGGNH